MTTGLKANSDGSAAIQVGGTDVITLTSGGAATFVTSPTTLAGNLTFSGTGNRITGDFSNATVANRVLFQTSTTNNFTLIGAIPNGTSKYTQYAAWTGSTANESVGYMAVDGGVSGAVSFGSDRAGTGTYLPMLFFTGGTESMRLSATSKALILAGGDTTANGTGIAFPATQNASSNANTLDDYEEGTFTPTISQGFSVGPTSYTNQLGRYTKIGRLVYFEIDLDPNGATGNATGIQFGGLPFISAAQPFGGVTLGYQITFNTNSSDTYLVNGNTTVIEIYTNAGASRLGNAAGVNINSRIVLSGCYTAA